MASQKYTPSELDKMYKDVFGKPNPQKPWVNELDMNTLPPEIQQLNQQLIKSYGKVPTEMTKEELQKEKMLLKNKPLEQMSKTELQMFIQMEEEKERNLRNKPLEEMTKEELEAFIALEESSPSQNKGLTGLSREPIANRQEYIQQKGTPYQDLDKEFAQKFAKVSKIADFPIGEGHTITSALLQQVYGPAGLEVVPKDGGQYELRDKFTQETYTPDTVNALGQLGSVATAIGVGIPTAIATVPFGPGAVILGEGAVSAGQETAEIAKAAMEAKKFGLISGVGDVIGKKKGQIALAGVAGAAGGALGEAVTGLFPAAKGLGKYWERAGNRGSVERTQQKALQEAFFEEEASQYYAGKSGRAGEIIKNAVDKKLAAIDQKADKAFSTMKEHPLNILPTAEPNLPKGLSPELADFTEYWKELSERFADNPEFLRGAAKALNIGVEDLKAPTTTFTQAPVYRVDIENGRITRDITFPEGQTIPTEETPVYQELVKPYKQTIIDIDYNINSLDEAIKDLETKFDTLTQSEFYSTSKNSTEDLKKYLDLQEVRQNLGALKGIRQDLIANKDLYQADSQIGLETLNMVADQLNKTTSFVDTLTAGAPGLKTFKTSTIAIPQKIREVLPGGTNVDGEKLGAVTPSGVNNFILYLKNQANMAKNTNKKFFADVVAAKAAAVEPLNKVLSKNLQQEGMSDITDKFNPNYSNFITTPNYGKHPTAYTGTQIGLKILEQGYKDIPITLRNLAKIEDPDIRTANFLANKFANKTNAKIINKVINDTAESPITAQALKQEIADSAIANEIYRTKQTLQPNAIQGVNKLSTGEKLSIFADTPEKQKMAQMGMGPVNIVESFITGQPAKEAANIPLQTKDIYKKVSEQPADSISYKLPDTPIDLSPKTREFLANITGQKELENAITPMAKVRKTREAELTPQTPLQKVQSLKDEERAGWLNRIPGTDTDIGSLLGAGAGAGAGYLAGGYPAATMGFGTGLALGGIAGSKARSAMLNVGNVLGNIPESAINFSQNPLTRTATQAIMQGVRSGIQNPQAFNFDEEELQQLKFSPTSAASQLLQGFRR